MSGIRPTERGGNATQPEAANSTSLTGRDATQRVAEDAARLDRLMRDGQRSRGNDTERRNNSGAERGEATRPGEENGELPHGRVRARGEQDQDASRGQEDGQDEKPPSAMFSGDDILAGLGAISSTAQAPPPGAPMSGIPAPGKEAAIGPTLSELVSTVAERVLVGERNGTPELMVTLRGDVLGQTELRISRGDGGIEIMIAAGNSAAGDLFARRGAELAGQLAQRLETRVVVQVAPPAASDGSGGQDARQDRRSRGLDALLTYVAG